MGTPWLHAKPADVATPTTGLHNWLSHSDLEPADLITGPHSSQCRGRGQLSHKQLRSAVAAVKLAPRARAGVPRGHCGQLDWTSPTSLDSRAARPSTQRAPVSGDHLKVEPLAPIRRQPAGIQARARATEARGLALAPQVARLPTCRPISLTTRPAAAPPFAQATPPAYLATAPAPAISHRIKW
jgi:hypothetical protein